jgi:hypothetical protein
MNALLVEPVLDGGDCSALRPVRFNPEEQSPGTHLIRRLGEYQKSPRLDS